MDEAKAVAAGYGERAPVNQEIPTESARNGEIPKIQTPLFGTTRHPALSGLVIQTFPSDPLPRGARPCRSARAHRKRENAPIPAIASRSAGTAVSANDSRR
ncbi:hypothetical protein F7R02_17650 [Xanthomonas cissicola]|nr:hypothetical protein F7R02_17650 [Xanthomonas cissicola]